MPMCPTCHRSISPNHMKPHMRTVCGKLPANWKQIAGNGKYSVQQLADMFRIDRNLLAITLKNNGFVIKIRSPVRSLTNKSLCRQCEIITVDHPEDSRCVNFFQQQRVGELCVKCYLKKETQPLMRTRSRRIGRKAKIQQYGRRV